MLSQSSFPRSRSSPLAEQRGNDHGPSTRQKHLLEKISKKFLTAGDRSLIYMGHITKEKEMSKSILVELSFCVSIIVILKLVGVIL